MSLQPTLVTRFLGGSTEGDKKSHLAYTILKKRSHGITFINNMASS